MKLQWNGHSCFTVESDGCRVVLDPYRMDGYPALHLEAECVLCSHEHFDHNARAAVTVLPAKQNPFTVETVATFHDDAQGSKRGSNTVHILCAEGMRVVHCGDLGHDLSERQLAALRGCDALLLPVGGVYTIDAAQAKRLADAVQPRVIVPMHYRHGAYGLRELADLQAFTALFPQVTVLDSNAFLLTKDAPRGVIVPQFSEKK